MNLKLIIISFLLIASVNAYAQNCRQINQFNISSINGEILDLSNNYGGGCIEIESGDYYNVPLIVLKSNIVLRIHGRLNSNNNLITVFNCENVKIIGDNLGALICSSLKNNSTGIEMQNSTNVNVEGMKINNFRNKGILVRGPNTTDIVIKNNIVTGSVATSGVGIAISDDQGAVTFCNIESNNTNDNRIGISVNKSKYINILSNHSYNNFLHGIGLDGIDSLSGDGPQNCIISNNLVYNNGGTCESGQTKSGLYLGNGSQKNIISNNIIRNNKCNGIFYYEDSENQSSSYNNSFISNQIIENEKWGIRLVNMKRGIISNNQILHNGDGGIQLDHSLLTIVSSNNIILNGLVGINFINSQNNNNTDTTLSANVIEGQAQMYKFGY